MSTAEVTPTETIQQIEDRLRKQIVRETETIFEDRFVIWKAKELAQYKDEQDETLRKLAKEYFDQVEAERKPLTKEEIAQLLKQEYVEFPIELMDGEQKRNFVIGELPQAVEEQFYTQCRDKLISKSADIAALSQETMDATFEEKIQAFLRTFGETFGILAQATVLILNRGRKSDNNVTIEWVRQNVSSIRQWNIVQAQIHVNRLRDFFSQVSLSGRRTMTMAQPLNAQQLQVPPVK